MDKNTTIHILRHAQTDFNVQKRYAGTIDVSLNQSGIRDCKYASKILIGMHFDLVITSTLKRTIETARFLLGGNFRSIQSEYCNERNYGEMQGLTEDEVEYLEPKIKYIKVGGNYHSLNPPGGESFESVQARAEKLLDLILREHAGLNLLVVSHGVFLQQFCGLLRGKNWIWALGHAIPNLLMTAFYLSGRRLVRESNIFLSERDQSNW